MATNHTPASPEALLKIVEQVKESYVAPPSRRHRGRPWVFSGRAFLLLAVVGGVLRTFKAQECRVPHRRTVERRLNATLPEAEAQVSALGQQVLAEVTPETDQPQASAIDGRMYQAQGPLWHQRDREQARIPARLRNIDTESAWSKSGYRGWVQGYRLVLQAVVFPAPVPLFARWCPNAVGESTVVTEALVADQLPVTALLLGDCTFGGADLVALYAQHGGWLLTPKRVTSKPAQPKAWPARAPLSSPVCGSIKSSFWATIDTIDQSLVVRRLSMKDDGASPPELHAGFNYLL